MASISLLVLLVTLTLLLNLCFAKRSIARVEVEAVVDTSSSRRLQADPTVPITELNFIEDPTIQIYCDPPGGFVPKALGLFARATRMVGIAPNEVEEKGVIYYEVSNTEGNLIKPPTLNSPMLTYESPYIHVFTGFDSALLKTIVMTAVFGQGDEAVLIPFRSANKTLEFTVEGGDRQNSFAFMIPGVETAGHFLRVALEVQAAARAQSAGSQEFANFYTPGGIGTYPKTDKMDAQVLWYDLPNELDKDLDGFEGGYLIQTDTKFYGVLIPFHNGRYFHGKVVIVNLVDMEDKETCLTKMRFERWNRDSQSVELYDGQDTPLSDACIVVLDLASLHPRAIGFRRGFEDSPNGYGYLSPGIYDVAVRLDFGNDGLNLGILSTAIVPMQDVDNAFGGFSGGFSDGSWACFTPMRSVYGAVAGSRSTDPADKFQMRPYYNAILPCISTDGWGQYSGFLGDFNPGFNLSTLKDEIISIDLGNLLPQLRGFSEAVKVGRYVYLAPLQNDVHAFSSQITRIYLGNGVNEWFGDVVRRMRINPAKYGRIRDLLDVMDLSQADSRLRGYSGIFSSGKYLILVPYRNMYEPANGQRGHSTVARLNMNDFQLSGIDFIELISTQRAQIPSVADQDLRGFCCGFASGKYAVMVPFYNAAFSGKLARFQIVDTDMSKDLQELDLTLTQSELVTPEITERFSNFKGFRGGFVSTWPAAVKAE